MAIAERRKRNAGADAARTRGAARLCQALALQRVARQSTCRTIPISAASSSRYFPHGNVGALRRCAAAHRLRREIIATQLTNSMINRGGATLIVRIADQTGRVGSPSIAAAFAAVRNSYDMIALNSEIDALDNKISGKLQLDLYAAVQDLLLDRLVWFLRNVDLTQGPGENRRRITARASRRSRPRSTVRCRNRPQVRATRGWRSLPRRACRKRWRAGLQACRY